jgi:3-oxoacyl-[acyl-carrier protein] reductase
MRQETHNTYALVTGGGRGIGRAIAEKFLSAGFKVLVIDRSETEIAWCDKHKNCFGLLCDVGDAAQVQKLLEQISAQHGSPSIVINNAGIGGPFHHVDEVSDAEWDGIINTNLRSVFMLSRWCLPLMRQRGYGRIVNIASIQGQFGAKQSSTYSASKHAVIGYTRNIAAEWGAYGITANAVCPGYIATAMGAQDDKLSDHTARVLQRTPVRRLGQPSEVAELVDFLVRFESGYINGSIINIDGGITADVGI